MVNDMDNAKLMRILLTLGGAVFCCLLLPIFAWAAPAEANARAQEQVDWLQEYTIGLGDLLEIQLWKEPELSKVQTVRVDGRISLPLVGDVKVVGKTTQALKAELEQLFSKLITEPSVAVILQKSESLQYYMIGKIARPGEFPIDKPVTVLQAIARSGGFLEWAKSEEILVVRQDNGGEKILKYNYQKMVEGVDADQNFLVMPGDTIIVP